MNQEDFSLLAQELEQSGGDTKRKLKSLPKTVLLGIAVELDPDMVSEVLEKGETKEDIIRAIESHIRGSLGNQSVEGWPFLQDFDIVFSEVDGEEETD